MLHTIHVCLHVLSDDLLCVPMKSFILIALV